MNICAAPFSRRQALLGAGSLLGAGALAGLAQTPALADSDSTVIGAWRVNIVPDDGSAPYQVLNLYTVGGGVAALSNHRAGSESVGLGQWERTGDSEYVQVFELFAFGADGTPTGIVRVRAASQLNENADRISGSASISYQPTGSSTFFPAGTTHFSGERITT